MLFSTLSGSTPWLMVRLPCGSMSTASTRWPDSLKATARLRAVVGLGDPALLVREGDHLGRALVLGRIRLLRGFLGVLGGIAGGLLVLALVLPLGLGLDEVLGPHAPGLSTVQQRSFGGN